MRTDYAYENDGDLDWERHGFQGAASATVPDDRWFGLDTASDAAGRLIRTSATDSRIEGALPAALTGLCLPVGSPPAGLWPYQLT